MVLQYDNMVANMDANIKTGNSGTMIMLLAMRESGRVWK